MGKGDADNDRLTFGVGRAARLLAARGRARGQPRGGQNPVGLAELPRPVLERAAELAAWHSKARGARGKVEVHVCRVADVSKPRGFAPGQVLLRRWALKVYPRGSPDYS